MDRFRVLLRFDPALRFFLAPRNRAGAVEIRYDGTSSLGHLVESAGVPLPEVGELRVGRRSATPSERIPPGQPVAVLPVRRPQPLPCHPPRFCLDVHLGKLARRMRLLGLDTAYRNDADDDELIQLASKETRALLTQDRALLQRRALPFGAYVRGAQPDVQLRDVLSRFAPPLSPWTRCGGCNGILTPAAKARIEHRLQPGTRRSYDSFAQCQSCGRLYWRGAHADRLAALIDWARQVVAGAGGPGSGPPAHSGGGDGAL
jgi:uncharacterized protein with PIN domain